MDELNTTQSVDVIVQDGFDALTLIDMGSSISLSQTDEDGDLHDVILGRDQAFLVIAKLSSILKEAH